MKKCEFCGKQISYFDQYCDDECHIKANKFYEKGERFGKLFAVINMICVFGIPIGLFMLSFAREVGLTVALASCVILGIMLIILPFPTENMISKFKILMRFPKKFLSNNKLFWLTKVLSTYLMTQETEVITSRISPNNSPKNLGNCSSKWKKQEVTVNY